MNIKLTKDEFMDVVNAVNVAKHFYEKQNMPQEAAKYEYLNELFMVAPSLIAEVSPGLTEAGEKLLKEVMARRGRDQEPAKVIQFPSGE